jgi:hypothetical protein
MRGFYMRKIKENKKNSREKLLNSESNHKIEIENLKNEIFNLQVFFFYPLILSIEIF